jgi:hypothetical protein
MTIFDMMDTLIAGGKARRAAWAEGQYVTSPYERANPSAYLLHIDGTDVPWLGQVNQVEDAGESDWEILD